MKRIILTAVFMFLTFTACGRNRDNDELSDTPDQSSVESGTAGVGAAVPEGMTERVLAIRSSDYYTGVIEQAAEMMNASWLAQGLPYVFRVEHDEYYWNDWEGRDAREARLRV